MGGPADTVSLILDQGKPIRPMLPCLCDFRFTAGSFHENHATPVLQAALHTFHGMGHGLHGAGNDPGHGLAEGRGNFTVDHP